jgi:adenylate cyclase
MAASRAVPVFATFCESHTSQIPFQAVARLLRAAFGVKGLDAQTARDHVRSRVPHANAADVSLIDDLLGITDQATELPAIDPDARRRRLTALINSVQLAGAAPAVYVVEDAHWIDEVSESMLAEFLTVIRQTPSLVLVAYRPEYRGALSHVPDAQTIVLAPLRGSETATLVSELLGSDPSVHGPGQMITDRAAGNPFFAEEMVRDLAERGVLNGQPGAYRSTAQTAEVNVPATLQAIIAARIDRLGSRAKHTLNAAAVIGARFDAELLGDLVDAVEVATLIEAQLVEQVGFTPHTQYAFRHPLIRAVAYESQLRSDRGQLQRRLATAIEQRDPLSADENAALIAGHLEAAGDSRAAFAWHMRAGSWLVNRDIGAARSSWRRAQQVADRLPDADPDRMPMRMAPRATLCATAFRIGGGAADTGFDELRELCIASGDLRSLAIGLMGLGTVHLFSSRRLEASRIADELIELLDVVNDPTLTIALSMGAATSKYEVGEMATVLQIAQRIVDLADDDPRKGDLFLGSPVTLALALRGSARLCLGIPGWKHDLRQAIDMARSFEPLSIQAVNFYAYVLAISYGALLADATALHDTAEVLSVAEHSADNIALFGAQTARGIALVHQTGADRDAGLELLAKARERGLDQRFSSNLLPVIDVQIAQQRTRIGCFDDAIALLRTVLDDCSASGGSIWSGLATAGLVEALLSRGAGGDLEAAQAAIDRLAAVSVDGELVLHEVTLLRLRALLARAYGDTAGYHDYRDRYRALAASLGFEGHMKWAEAMP